MEGDWVSNEFSSGDTSFTYCAYIVGLYSSLEVLYVVCMPIVS